MLLLPERVGVFPRLSEPACFVSGRIASTGKHPKGSARGHLTRLILHFLASSLKLTESPGGCPRGAASCLRAGTGARRCKRILARTSARLEVEQGTAPRRQVCLA